MNAWTRRNTATGKGFHWFPLMGGEKGKFVELGRIVAARFSLFAFRFSLFALRQGAVRLQSAKSA